MGYWAIRLARIASASGDNLCPAVTKAVEVGSTVCIDGWKGYNGLKVLGYKHEIVRPTPALGENLLPLAISDEKTLRLPQKMSRKT